MIHTLAKYSCTYSNQGEIIPFPMRPRPITQLGLHILLAIWLLGHHEGHIHPSTAYSKIRWVGLISAYSFWMFSREVKDIWGNCLFQRQLGCGHQPTSRRRQVQLIPPVQPPTANHRTLPAISSSGWLHKMITQCGDVESNPGPSPQIASVSERRYFLAACKNDTLTTWMRENLFAMGFDICACVYSKCADPPQADLFVATVTQNWESILGFPIPQLPFAATPPHREATSALKDWWVSLSDKDKKRVTKTILAEQQEKLERQGTNPGGEGPPSKKRPRENPPEPEENDILEPAILWDHPCPAKDCEDVFPNSWATSVHFNSHHKGEATCRRKIAMSGTTRCNQCSSLRPLEGNCPSCGGFLGLMSMTIHSVIRGRAVPTPAPTQVPPSASSSEAFLSSLLKSSTKTLNHIPYPARQGIGEALAKALANFARSKTTDSLHLLLVLPQVLLSKGRGGKRRARTEEARRQLKIDMWEAGEEWALWNEVSGATEESTHKLRVPKRTPPEDEQLLSEKLVGSMLSLTRQGLPGKAAKQLVSAGVADWTKEVLQSIQKLFPRGDTSQVPVYTSKAEPFTEEEVMDSLKRMKKGKSPGPSGLRTEHLNDLVEHPACGHLVREGLTLFVNTVAFGGCPRDLASALNVGRTVPLLKPDSSIRPLVVGETLRNLVATCWNGRVLSELEEELAPRHLGLGKSTGVSNSVIRAKLWASSLPQDHVLIKVDFRNAYNSVDRSRLVQSVMGRCDELGGWASWCLGKDTLLGAGKEVVKCSSGVQQGDPLSPLLFSLLVADVAAALEDHWNTPTRKLIYQQWYLDDGLIMVHKDRAVEAMNSVQKAAEVVGLALNRSKCEVLGRGDEVKELALAMGAEAFQDPKLWTYLGCPLSSAELDHPAFKAAISRCEKLSKALRQIECPEAQLAIWRQCLGACRIQHLTDSCTAQETDALAVLIRDGMKEGLADILNLESVSDKTWSQASLPVRDGGLGLLDPTVTNADAHLSALARLPKSFYSGLEDPFKHQLDKALDEVARRRGQERNDVNLWLDRTTGRGASPIQEAARMSHKSSKATLVSTASPEDKARLTSVSCPHAMAWSLGPGYGRPMSDTEFRAAMHWTLGIDVQAEEGKCPCGATSDKKGRHFVCCQLFDRRTRRHNEWRDTTANITRSAGMSVEVEASPENERLTPGDILIPGWRNGKPLAIDFSITAQALTSAPDVIAANKTKKYERMCAKEGWKFIPCVGDSFGAVRDVGGKFLTQLCKAKAEKVGKGCWPTPQALFWQAMSTCLLRRAAGAIAEAWAAGAMSPDNVMSHGDEREDSPEQDSHTGAGTSNAQPLQSVSSGDAPLVSPDVPPDDMDT
jgi:hypothetical protein